MARPVPPGALWAVVGPALPADTPGPKGGRPPLTHRQARTGILLVLKTGLPWEDLPAGMGGGSGMSCWRRPAAWPADGTWARLHALPLARPHHAGKLDWRRAAIDSPSGRAGWGAATGPNPTDRGRAGTKSHLMVDAAGVPLAATATAASAHDVTALLPTAAARPPAGYGSPGRTPRQLLGDRAYRSAGHEGVLRWLGIRPRFARPGVTHGSGLGKRRYAVEQTIAAVHQNRRREARDERRADIRRALLTLAGVKVCWYRLAGRSRQGFVVKS